MNKIRLKKQYRKLILFSFIFICLVGITFSLYNITKWYLENKENSKIKKILEKSIVDVKNENLENKEETVKKYKIDFNSLKEQNNDTIAYVKLNNTNIDYIVVKGNNNDYYLKHNFYKNRNNSGWIFADYHNKFDESDKNIIIYGHNTKDGSMFGTLKTVLNKDWYENKENHKILLMTEKGTYYYLVFSTYSIIPEDYYINTKFNDNNAFENFIKTIKSRSIYDFGIDVTKDDKILTLSSCINNGKKRVVLHAKLIETE